MITPASLCLMQAIASQHSYKFNVLVAHRR